MSAAGRIDAGQGGGSRSRTAVAGRGGVARLARAGALAAAVLLAGPLPSGAGEAASPAESSQSEAIAADLVRFAPAAVDRIEQRGRTAYIYEATTGGAGLEPEVHLRARLPVSFTDCSGWVNYLLAVVTPLHQAVLARHRLTPRFNTGVVDEAAQPWARAMVIYDYLRQQPEAAPAADGGFRRIADFRRLRPGDIAAWCLGGWCEPQTLKKLPDTDTGHTFVVVGHPRRVSPNTGGYRGVSDGVATLDLGAAGVIAVPVIDSSSLRHFDDSRNFRHVPRDAPPTSVPGGLGSGELWFAVDAHGAPLQMRFSRADAYFPNRRSPGAVRFAAGRPTARIDLAGPLVVAPYSDAVSQLAGRSYGALPVRLGGRGRLTIGRDARLRLTGTSSFFGGVVVEERATLSVERDGAFGAATNPVVLGGRIELGAGFAGSAERTLKSRAGGLLAASGRTSWKGPLEGRALAVDVAGRLTLRALGVTVSGRRTLDLR